jgi:hypothetical protein
MGMKFSLYERSEWSREWIVTFDGWATGSHGPEYRTELKEWCKQSFGRPAEVDVNNFWPARWQDEIMWGKISFRDKKDAEWFMLRWA